MIFLTRLKTLPPEEGQGIRFAIYQGERPVGTPEALQDNLAKLDEIVREARKYHVQLISFPELYLEGYTLTPELVQQLAEPVDGPSISRVAAVARAHHMSIICPYAERDDRGGEARYYDAIAVLGADGALLHNYRKTHLFGAAERINYTFGYTAGVEDPFRVSLVAGFPVGVLNCYEAEFPELSRILALRGAKLIVIPTAADYYYTLPDGRRTKVPYPDVTHTLIPAHAYENVCFIAYCNRFGREHLGGHTWHYRGNSMLCGPHGDMILSARPEETLLIADVVPGDYGPTHPEGHYLKNRRPELYKQLVAMQAAFEGGYTYQIPPA
jgi:predicted amidohydrolase